MNEFELLVESVRARFPGAQILVDEPENADSSHLLDVSMGETDLQMAWRSDKGFGFFVEGVEYAEKPNKTVRTKDEALAIITEMLEPSVTK